jgi:hypothetical protein
VITIALAGAAERAQHFATAAADLQQRFVPRPARRLARPLSVAKAARRLPAPSPRRREGRGEGAGARADALAALVMDTLGA